MVKEAFNRKRSIFCGPLEKELRKWHCTGQKHGHYDEGLEAYILNVDMEKNGTGYFISQLKDRFLNQKGILKSIQTLLPKNIVRASDEDLETAVEAIGNQWPNDVDASPESFFNELKTWRRNFLDQKNLHLIPTDFISSLNRCNEIIFPCTRKALKLFCTLPVTTATPEWSFSTLRYLKTYLRSTMGADRLNGLSSVKKMKVRIHKTVILPAVLYGCETLTLTLREEQRLRVFENKVLRKIFGAKRDEVTGEWRKLHNAELHALYSSPDIIRNIKSRRLRWAGHVARMGESRNAYRVLVDNIKIAAEQNIGYYETKKKKPWFDEDCCMVVERRKQAKFKFLQDPVEVNRDNYFNKKREANRRLRNKKRDYLNEKLNDVETNSKNKNIRDLYKGIKEFKNGYQARVNVIKNENGDLFADAHSILNRWKNYFGQLLNIHRPNRNDRDEIEIQTAEPFISEPTLSEVEIAIENLKNYKSPGIDQIPAELIQEGGSALSNEIYKLVLAIWRKLHNAELHALYSSPDIIRNIKCRRLRWAGHVARMGESKNTYRVLVGRPEGKKPLGRPRRRWEDSIKMDLREVGYDDREWIHLAQDRGQWRQ
ncbi:hypothetical protein ANN_16215 [Periplaneta americana]|uniref:HAT C-terminal dimerisation domain-containing protein n=1 Tax=Periplaneta americana TaxID=6978 RepID=A0ABQ8SIH2_PERAM|nr:hypothetical protein ANN_16215 [Periplaneta americana]